MPVRKDVAVTVSSQISLSHQAFDTAVIDSSVPVWRPFDCISQVFQKVVCFKHGNESIGHYLVSARCQMIFMPKGKITQSTMHYSPVHGGSGQCRGHRADPERCWRRWVVAFRVCTATGLPGAVRRKRTRADAAEVRVRVGSLKWIPDRCHGKPKAAREEVRAVRRTVKKSLFLQSEVRHLERLPTDAGGRLGPLLR